MHLNPPPPPSLTGSNARQAALLGEGVYGFGELMAHPLLKARCFGHGEGGREGGFDMFYLARASILIYWYFLVQ